MDQLSSPGLPAANLPINKSHGSNESLLTGKKIQGFDDSSSVTSMSSTSRSTRCMVCKDEETVVKPLITCTRCKRKIHPGCAHPYIDDYKADWTCPRCKRDQHEIAKMGIAAAFSASKASKSISASYSSPYARSDPTPTAPSESPKESTKMPTIRCEIAGCNNIILYVASNTRPLCIKHKQEQRHAIAKAAPPKPASVSRPFRKDKIYPVRPDDKQLLKRKRPAAKSANNASYQDSHSPFAFQAAPDARSEFTFQSPQTLRSPPVAAAPSPTPRSASKRTPEQKGRQFQFFASAAKSSEEIEQSVDDLNRSLGSASMAESPIEPTASWQANPSIPDSVRATPRVLAQDSPEYSPPPPPQLDDEVSPWVVVDNRDDSPGSQIAQELAATASQQDASETNDLSESGKAGLSSIEEEITSRSHQFNSTRRYQAPCEDDEEMFDANARAFLNRLASEHHSSPAKSASAAVQSPTSSTYSANVSSHKESEATPSDTDLAPEHETYDELVSSDSAPPLNSIEAIRAQRAANFDTSELDSFLFKQAQPKSEEQPTAKELLSTQIWGHIDPRVAWPKKMTPQEIQEKIKEIEARGGKKANFGKILTAQVRKERADKGWHIHQTSERRSEAECNEMDRRMEELFGREGIANCVPGIRNGRLVMIEQLEQEEPLTGAARRKRKREPKIYPVIGAQ